jgi:3-methylcrotonyl-CoA carboxylase alpha subunit
MFTRILIANRGEIAVRIIRACREMGISPAVVYSAADAGALHVRLADVAVPIGPAPAAESYLRTEAIIAAAQQVGAQAIHPGYGFLSENAAFARACRDAGLVFIGPPPEAIHAMGGKIGARKLAVEAGVPVVPGYDGADQSVDALAAEAVRIGFPLLIKASAGGGGKGMRVVNGPDEFVAALEGARRESRAAFGDATVFLERLILRPRHVEIQVLADSHGNVVHIGERECSIQRRHQKIVEEAPSPALDPELRATMGAAAVRVAQAAGYVNAGTVEFVLGADGGFYFLEMNTRLQVEHPVTEQVSGLDLVQLQIAIADGAQLPFTQEQIEFRGHAIEVRLYAEDPVTFLPAIGQVSALLFPHGPGVRIDAGLESGDEVSVHYDPMIAKLVVTAGDRPAAVRRLQRILAETLVLGVTTNVPLLRALAEHPAFAAGDTHTGFLGEQQIEAIHPVDLPTPVLAAAAVTDLTAGGPLDDPFAAIWRAGGVSLPLAYTDASKTYRLRALPAESGWFLQGDDLDARVTLLARRGNELVLAITDTAHESERSLAVERVVLVREQTDLLLAYRGWNYRLSRPQPLTADSAGHTGGGHDGASLAAPMPGTMVKVLVSEGQEVSEGQPLLVLEAMKMEHTVVAPYAGVVQRLPYAEGASVTGGSSLIDLQPLEADA